MGQVEDAVKTLGGAVKTAKGRAALGVLEQELQAGPGVRSKGASDSSRGGFAGARSTVRQMVANRDTKDGDTA